MQQKRFALGRNVFFLFGFTQFIIISSALCLEPKVSCESTYVFKGLSKQTNKEDVSCNKASIAGPELFFSNREESTFSGVDQSVVIKVTYEEAEKTDASTQLPAKVKIDRRSSNPTQNDLIMTTVITSNRFRTMDVYFKLDSAEEKNTPDCILSRYVRVTCQINASK